MHVCVVEYSIQCIYTIECMCPLVSLSVCVCVCVCVCVWGCRVSIYLPAASPHRNICFQTGTDAETQREGWRERLLGKLEGKMDRELDGEMGETVAKLVGEMWRGKQGELEEQMGERWRETERRSTECESLV